MSTNSKFGFPLVEKVTATVLRQRIAYLTKMIDAGKWSAEKHFHAQKQRAHYVWQLANDPRFGAKKKKSNRRKAA